MSTRDPDTVVFDLVALQALLAADGDSRAVAPPPRQPRLPEQNEVLRVVI
jgi:hypothetical protein